MKTNPQLQFRIMLIVASAALGSLGSQAQAQQNYEPYAFATFAGFPPGSANGTGPGAQFNEPYGVAADTSGNVYVADAANHIIRKIDSAGNVTTLAGSAGNPGSADRTGSAAQFNFPQAVAVDTSGNVYVADTNNNTIRKIDSAGNVTTLAGSPGVTGSADGTGSAAQFNFPSGVAVDTSDNVYVADQGNSTIRQITSGGVVTTLAGSAGNFGSADGTGSAALFNAPSGVAVDTSGNVYVADTVNGTIRKVTSAGVVTTLAGSPGNLGSADGTGSAALFAGPSSVAVDSSGNVYVADTYNNTIRAITPAGVVTTLAGSAAAFPGNVDGTGGAARFNSPSGVAADSSGNVYVADTFNDTIRKITTPGGVVTTLAGSAAGSGSADGTGSTARFNFPLGVAVDNAGNVYVGDEGNNTIRKITTPGGVVTTLAGSPGVTGSTDGTGSAALFFGPSGVAVDGSGNVYVADSGNNTIRKITSAGVVTTLAGSPGVTGSADGTGSAAQFNFPRGVAADSAGNVYVVDGGNETIRKITPAGVVTTLAGCAGVTGSADGTGGPCGTARFNTPRGVAVDSAGNVYVGDTLNRTVRKIDSAGNVTTLAGLAGHGGNADGTGSAARFGQLRGLAVDSAGNVYVCDTGRNTIRKITPAAVVTTLAGSAGNFSGAADGTGSAVLFNLPFYVAVDTSGNLYVTDTGNNTSRRGNPVVPPKTTPVGNSVMVNAGTVGIASVSLTFPQVTMAGTTSVTLINPASAGSLPGGYALTGAGFGYEIETTAAYVTPPPIILAFQVPNVDAATFSQLRVLHNEGGTLVDATCPDPRPGPTPDPTTQTIYASVTSLSPFVIAKTTSAAHIQQPINADRSSVFSVRRGVVPVKFNLTLNGVATCQLPLATIAVTRTAGGTIGPVDESVYSGSADTGSNFRISSCQYVYNLSASALGVGTYRVDIKIAGTVVGSATFGLN
jgi:sugar lactone lactonase YvrE